MADNRLSPTFAGYAAAALATVDNLRRHFA